MIDRKPGKAILKEFRRLSRLTGASDSLDVLQNTTISEYSKTMPKDGVRTYKEYELERNSIIKAWQLLNERKRIVLYYSFLFREKASIHEIANHINLSSRTVEKIKAEGIENFTRIYKDGILWGEAD